jgi:hypothetical protein
MVAGMGIQAVVPRTGSAAGGPAALTGSSGRGSGWVWDAFSGVQSNNYWSSTSNVNNPSNAWNVNLNDGNVNNDDKTNTNYVWPVRGGEWWACRP